MDHQFNKGSDLQIAVNGEPLGGVISLERAVINEADVIAEFLTDEPVALLPHRRYELTFRLLCAGECVFENEIESIAVTERSRTEIYTGCTVKQLKSKTASRGWVEYTAVVEAKERSAADE